MEAVAFYAYEASSDLAAERGQPIDVPRGGRMDWGLLREKVAAQGMRNSNVIAIAPTATIANIMGTSPCIEPMYKNLFAKSNLSGDFTVLNPFLVAHLKGLDLWNRELAEEIKAHDGDLTAIASIPEAVKDHFRTAF